MDHHKSFKLLNDSAVTKFVTKKRIRVSDWSGSQYSINKNIRLKTSMLRPNLSDYYDAYIAVKGEITVKETDNANGRNKKHTFKNNRSQKRMISEMISTKIRYNNLLGVIVKYGVVQFLQKKTTCVLTEICCVLLVFIFPDLVWCWWHIIKQIFHAFFCLTSILFTLGIIIFK